MVLPHPTSLRSATFPLKEEGLAGGGPSSVTALLCHLQQFFATSCGNCTPPSLAAAPHGGRPCRGRTLIRHASRATFSSFLPPPVATARRRPWRQPHMEEGHCVGRTFIRHVLRATFPHMEEGLAGGGPSSVTLRVPPSAVFCHLLWQLHAAVPGGSPTWRKVLIV